MVMTGAPAKGFDAATGFELAASLFAAERSAIELRRLHWYAT